MRILLQFSALIDKVNGFVGKSIIWLVLAAAVISAGNAVARKVFNVGSNAFLEIQWYLFAAVFTLGAGYVFLKNGHVRIDVIANKLSRRTRVIIDIVGILVFLLPLTILMADLAWPIVAQAYETGEMSSNAGGLIRWPMYALLPAGFTLLGLQGISELIKRIAFLAGKAPAPFDGEGHGHEDAHKDSTTPAAGETHK